MSAQQNPAYTYQEGGTYMVRLPVSNVWGSDTLIKTEFITVYTPVVSCDVPLSAGCYLISISVTNANQTVPTEVTGNDYVHDPICGTYATTTISALESGKGYWVSATENCILSVNGSRLEGYTGNMNQGWNLIGSVYENR